MAYSAVNVAHLILFKDCFWLMSVELGRVFVCLFVCFFFCPFMCVCVFLQPIYDLRYDGQYFCDWGRRLHGDGTLCQGEGEICKEGARGGSENRKTAQKNV